MFEEKDLNQQNNSEFDQLSNEQIETPVSNMVQSPFLYGNPIVPSEINEFAESSILTTDIPQYTEQPVEQNDSVEEVEELVVEEQPVIQEVNNISDVKLDEQKPVTNEDAIDNQLKNNLIFMLVFAIVMIAIIVALPYISGYK